MTRDAHSVLFSAAYPAPKPVQPCARAGVIIWELATGQVPERGRLRQPVTPDECPVAIAELIEACLAYDPAARPDARQVYDALMARRAAAAC